MNEHEIPKAKIYPAPTLVRDGLLWLTLAVCAIALLPIVNLLVIFGYIG
jgi:hypothetical protein